MSIANRIGLLLALAALALLAVNAAVVQKIVLSGYIEMDEAVARDQIRWLRGELQSERAELERFVSDWGAWDDAYRFAKDHDREFIVSNLETKVMQEQDLALIWIVDPEGRTIWGRALDPAQPLPKPFPAFPGPALSGDSPLIGAGDDDAVFSGMMETALGPMIVASHPIVTSHQQGPARGFIIAGRLLNEKRWQAMGDRIDAQVVARLASEATKDSKMSLLLAKLTPGGIEIEQSADGKTLQSHAVVYDISTRPLVLLTATQNRQHYFMGVETLGTALLAQAFAILSLMALVYLALRHYVTLPLTSLAEGIKNVGDRVPSEDMVSSLVKRGEGEVAVVTREVEGMLGRIAYLSHTDSLTGLPNRVAFHEKALHALALAKRHQTMCAILLLDLDGFKQVNESLGHEAGDRLLIAVAKQLKRILRESDSVARFGGDEFLILTENLPAVTGAADLARRILDVFKSPLNAEDVRNGRGCSIGIAVYPGDAATYDDLLRMADIAMYRAKSSGGNTWRCHAENLDCRHQHDMEKEKGRENPAL